MKALRRTGALPRGPLFVSAGGLLPPFDPAMRHPRADSMPVTEQTSGDAIDDVISDEAFSQLLQDISSSSTPTKRLVRTSYPPGVVTLLAPAWSFVSSWYSLLEVTLYLAPKTVSQRGTAVLKAQTASRERGQSVGPTFESGCVGTGWNWCRRLSSTEYSLATISQWCSTL